MKKELQYFLPDLFMEMRPPAAMRQPSTRRRNLTAGRERRINLRQHSTTTHKNKTLTLLKEGSVTVKGFKLELVRQLNPEERTVIIGLTTNLEDGTFLTCLQTGLVEG